MCAAALTRQLPAWQPWHRMQETLPPWQNNMSCLDVTMLCVFFFFQAEDGIRDLTVTGVQTCALPIFTAADINSVERAVEREILIVSAELKRGLGILATTGSTAPFVGLLGTVMGIVNAFTGMAASGGGGSLGAVSAGIAEALITTAFGLIVAIPAVWLYNYFTTKIDFLSVEMTYTSKELIDYLIKSVGSEFGRSIFTKEFQTQKASQTSGPVSH